MEVTFPSLLGIAGDFYAATGITYFFRVLVVLRYIIQVLNQACIEGLRI